MSTVSTGEHVREIAHRFSVCYQVWPESMVLLDHTIRQVGFSLDLYGRDGQPAALFPGDERSKEIYRGLREIAAWIIPKEECGCRCVLGEFNVSVHYGNQSRDSGSVQLTIHILHLSGVDQPINGAHTRTLQKIEDRLKSLAVGQGS